MFYNDGNRIFKLLSKNTKYKGDAKFHILIFIDFTKTKPIMRTNKMKEQISPKKQIEDSKTIIKMVLNLPEVDNVTKYKVIDLMLWNITGAYGKLNTKFVSEGAITSKDEKLQHEHVFTKKYLINRILNEPDNLDSIFELAFACIVTEKEHHKLSNVKDVEGWSRYVNAGIKVFALDDDIVYRRLLELKKREFLKLNFSEREKILLVKPAILFVE